MRDKVQLTNQTGGTQTRNTNLLTDNEYLNAQVEHKEFFFLPEKGT